MKRRIELETAEVTRLKRLGMSDADIGKLFGVSRQVVINWRRMNNIPSWIHGRPRKWRAKEREAFRQALLPKVIDMIHRQKMTKTAVSKELGITIRTISKWLTAEEDTLSQHKNEIGKERLIFDYICWYKFQHDGNAPTRSEIARYLNVANSGLAYYLDLLRRNKLIEIDMSGLTAGHISVAGGVWRPPMGWAKPLLRSLSDSERAKPSIMRNIKVKKFTFDFICIYKTENDGNSPSMEQIAHHVNAPKVAIYQALKELQEEKSVRIQPDKHTNKIEVVGSNWWPPGDWKEPATPIKSKKITNISKKRQNGLKRRGRLCQCRKGEIKWTMTVPVGKNGNETYTYSLCSNCAQLAVESGDKVFPLEESE